MSPRRGVLIVSHGSREAGWVKLVDEAVAAAREALAPEWPDVPVVVAYLELVDGRLIQDGIDALEAAGVSRLFALPLFVSSGSTHVDEIGWALGAYPAARTDTDLESFSVTAALEYGRPMDDDPELVDALLDRLSALSAGRPERESVLLVAHGSDHEHFREAWLRGMRSLAAAVRERGGYAAADVALLRPDQAAERLAALHARQSAADGAEVLVVPLFLSEGYFTQQVVPRRLSATGVAYRYDGRTLMPHPSITRWIVRRTKEWLDAGESEEGI